MESGRIESTSTAELLRQHAQAAASGCLRIERDGVEARVWFRDGLIYTATAPEARPRLGDRLVGAGHITEDQLLDTLQLQRSSDVPRRIGELLIEQGFIDRETMRTYVREQIADSVAAAMSWTTGLWTFTEGDEVAEDVALDMSVENLLMEGSRRLEEWEVITSRLGSVDAVVDFAPGGSQADLSLTPDEWSMLTHIDGVSTVREIAMDSGYGQFEAARIIYGLLTAGVVRVLPEDGEEEEEAYPQDEYGDEAETGAADELLKDFTIDEVDVEPVEAGVDALPADGDALPDAVRLEPSEPFEVSGADASEAAQPEPADHFEAPSGAFASSEELNDFSADLAALSDPAPPQQPDVPSEAAPAPSESIADPPPPLAPQPPAPGPQPGAPASAPPPPGSGDAAFPAAPPPPGSPEASPEDQAASAPGGDTAGGQVDRNELLREFAALDDDHEERSPSQRPRPRPQGSAPNGGGSRPVPPPESDERDEDKKGFFGRFRKG